MKPLLPTLLLSLIALGGCTTANLEEHLKAQMADILVRYMETKRIT